MKWKTIDVLNTIFFGLYLFFIKRIGGTFLSKKHIQSIEDGVGKSGGHDFEVKAPWYYERVITHELKESGVICEFICYNDGFLWFSVSQNKLTLDARENCR